MTRTLRWARVALPATVVVAVGIFLAGGGAPPAEAQQPPGSLDTTFGGDGKVTTNISTAKSVANAVVALDGGKILVAGYGVAGTDDFALARYTAAGALDNTFGTGGIVLTDFAGGPDSVRAVAVQSDGKILVAGGSYNGSNIDFALARYSAAGELDNAFGTGGKVTTAIGSSHDRIHAMELLSDGKILAAGSSHNGSNYDFALARYTTAGALDTTFDTDGKVTTAIGSGDDSGRALALQADGKIVVAGSINSGAQEDFALARYTAAGALDNTFGTVVSGSIRSGKVTTAIGTKDDRVGGVVVQSDGKIVVAGYSFTATRASSDFALARYTAAGVLDTTFGTGGKVTTDFDSGIDLGQAMVAQSDGKILVAGYSGPAGNYGFALARYSATGALDTTFGTVVSGGTRSGKVTADFGARHDYGRAVALQSDGKILVAGDSHNGTHEDFALARFTAAGALDTAFGGGDGKVTTGAGANHDYGYAMALQSDGKVVVAGNAFNGATRKEDFALARHNSDGTLDTGFGTGGKVTTDFGSVSDNGRAMAIQTDGKIVVGGYSHNGSNHDFALARYTTAGALDTDFGTGGKVTTAIGSGDDRVRAMAIQTDGKILVGGRSHNGSNHDFALARYTTAGALDTSFGTGGKVTTAIGSGDDRVRAIAIQSDGKIVVAGQSHNGSDWDSALARYSATGALDTAFGTGGKVTTANGAGHDAAVSVALGTNGKIVTAGGSFNGSNYDFALARYSAAGALDNTFGTVVSGSTRSGKVITAGGGGGHDFAFGVLVADDGKIFATGYMYNGNDNDFALARYTTAGVLDTAFGTGGIATTPISAGGDDRIYGAAFQDDGKIVAAGFARGQSYDFSLTRYLNQSADADLSALTASAATGPTNAFNAITLTPAFDADTAAYTAAVANNITHAKITPTVADTGKATVQVGTTGNLADVTSGTASTAIALSAGANAITVRVTAENSATKNYTVTITRQSPLSDNNNLSALTASAATGPTNTFNTITLTPAFSAARTAYTATVANNITHAKITPTVADTGKATVQVGTTGNLADVTSGTASTAIALSAGANAITVRVTAENNATKNYTVTITRQSPLSDNNNLSALTASAATGPTNAFNTITLTPAFDAATATYTATVANNITHAKITPTVADTGKATVQVGTTGNLADVTSGTASTAIALSAGANAITVRVTAENNTTKNYTVTITRQSPPTDTTPTVSLSASPNPVRPAAVTADPQYTWEPAARAHVTITATLSRALSRVVIVPVSVTPAAPDRGVLDSIVISAGAVTGTATIMVLEDLDTQDDTFTVALDTDRLPSPLTAGSPASVTVTVDDTDSAAAPPAVTNLAVTPKVRYLLLQWDQPTARTTHYDIQYKTATAPDQTATTSHDPSTGWVSLPEYADETATTRRAAPLVSGTAYDVRVRAMNSTAAGPWTTRQATPQ